MQSPDNERAIQTHAALVEARDTFRRAVLEHRRAMRKIVLDTDLVPMMGFQECKDSPLGHCIYDEKWDPTCESCLHCGEPEERK